MPRDGSNVYHYPTGIEGEPNQTIESIGYNSFLSDVEQDLNAPRPILSGGTAATSAAAALTNLGGEMAGQVVTNYDSYAFKAGSFLSNPGATSAPTVGASYAGICYVYASDYLTIEARMTTAPGTRYVRQKIANVWGAWVNSDADMDAKKVNRAGDTMTGNLTISNNAPILQMNETDTGHNWYTVVDGDTWSLRRALSRWAAAAL
jgi:hypothetical protein